MSINRRKFLGMLGGAAALSIAGKAGYEVVASDEIKKAANENLDGKRWAMVIDLKKFAEGDNFERCIEACNREHNVPHIENPKHEVKWVWKEKYRHAFIEQENHALPEDLNELPVLLMCNHCDNPPCVSVCPTKATWRREDGIIMMDWHRCIGCRYCIAACPYGSRSFNYQEPRPHIRNVRDSYPARTKGVVEKCTFCAEYIVNGEYTRPPACVQACNNGSMIFGNLYDKSSEVYKTLSTRFSIRRKPELGSVPEIYYLI